MSFIHFSNATQKYHLFSKNPVKGGIAKLKAIVDWRDQQKREAPRRVNSRPNLAKNGSPAQLPPVNMNPQFPMDSELLDIFFLADGSKEI